MGGETIWVSEMRFGVKACTVEMCWIGGVGTLYVTIGFGTGAENFVTSGTLFVSISSASSGGPEKGKVGFCLRKW